MSDIQEIDVFVRPDGTVAIEVRGIKGENCLAVTKKLEDLLGGAVVERVHTDEFHEVEQAQTQSDWVQQQSG